MDLHIVPSASAADWAARHYPSDAILCIEQSNASGPFLPFRSNEDYPRYRRICLWCGRRLGDHVFLCSAAAALHEAGLSRAKLDIVFLEKQARFMANQQTPSMLVTISFDTLFEETRRLPPPRRALSEDEWVDLCSGWAAVMAGTPAPLLSWLNVPQKRSFRLADCLRTLIRHYPARANGLDHWLDWALQCIARYGPGFPSWNSHFMANLELDRPGDIMPRVLDLTPEHCDHPLLAAEEIGSRYPRLTLTPVGRDVLEGRANHLELNGIDRWVGGVHLSSAKANVWVRDGDTLLRWSPSGRG